VIWAISIGGVECGGCCVRIPDQEPIARVGPASMPVAKRKIRCVNCAGELGGTVDWVAVEAARAALTKRRANQSDAPLTPMQYAIQARPTRVSVRSLKPVEPFQADDLFDHAKAAAGDRD
jgi:hypothetical protein